MLSMINSMFNPARVIAIAVVFWDFMRTADTGDFTKTDINSGTGAVATAKNGLYVITGAATTDASGANIQSTNEVFAFTVGKKLTTFKIRVKFSNATKAKFFLGFSLSDTSALASRPTDGVYFLKTGVSAKTFYGGVSRDSTENLTALVGGIEDDTWTELGFTVAVTGDNKGEVTFWQDGQNLGTVSVANLPIESEETMKITLEFQSGSADGTQTMSIDYVGVQQER